LRSRGGCLSEEQFKGQVPDGFTFEERPVHEYVVAKFSGSPSIGPYKVYPKVKSYAAEKGLKLGDAVIEVYTVEGSYVTTTYCFPIENAAPK
jgi:hypothetical protein